MFYLDGDQDGHPTCHGYDFGCHDPNNKFTNAESVSEPFGSASQFQKDFDSGFLQSILYDNSCKTREKVSNDDQDDQAKLNAIINLVKADQKAYPDQFSYIVVFLDDDRHMHKHQDEAEVDGLIQKLINIVGPTRITLSTLELKDHDGDRDRDRDRDHDRDHDDKDHDCSNRDSKNSDDIFLDHLAHEGGGKCHTCHSTDSDHDSNLQDIIKVPVSSCPKK